MGGSRDALEGQQVDHPLNRAAASRPRTKEGSAVDSMEKSAAKIWAEGMDSAASTP